MLEVAELWVHYGRVAAVQGLSFEVNEGELVSVVGHNGAGKTTTLLTIAGALKATAGTIAWNGRSIAGLSPDAILRLGISLVPENRHIFSRLTVGENLRIGTSGRRDRREANRDLERMLERFPVLRHNSARPGSQLSGGEQQQLALARALLSRPRLLLLDEPTLGLAPQLVDRVFDLLQELRDDGMTILLVEQNAGRAIEIADRAYLVRSGARVEKAGTAQELGLADLTSSFLGIRGGA